MSGMLLSGLDGGNPLGFLAAVGTARLLSLRVPAVRLHWVQQSGWRPCITGIGAEDQERLCELLLEAPAAPTDLLGILGKNITVSAPGFAAFAQKATENGNRSDRRGADFAAAFGSEVCTQEKKDRIQYTSLCFITGSGHQDFLETIKALHSCTTVEHVRKALFGVWDFHDKGLSLRWDPGEAREYAMLWGDPAKEGAWTEWGANRLAIEALPISGAGESRLDFRRKTRNYSFRLINWR